MGLARVALAQHVREPTPTPMQGALAQGLWGFAQPLLGLRLWFGTPELRRRGIVPVLGLLAICLAAGWSAEGGLWKRLVVAQATLLALAPVPSVLFARSYARLAASAHERLGLGPAAPYLKGLGRYAWEFVLQALCVALGVAPLVALVELVPAVGPVWAWLLGSLWALHWVVVEGYDTGRVRPQGGGPEEVDPRAWGGSWFGRLYDRVGRAAWVLGAPVRLFGGLVDGLAAEWRPELALMERHPAQAVGFGLAAAALLAVPGLNLLFRPAVVVGAVHLRARLPEGP